MKARLAGVEGRRRRCSSSPSRPSVRARRPGRPRGHDPGGLDRGDDGAYGSTGVAMVNGAKLAIADLNARGGALGKKFSLQSYNDRPRRRSRPSCSSGSSAAARSRSSVGRHRARDVCDGAAVEGPHIGAVDDAGLTIYPDGPTKPPFEWVWSWG